MSRSLTEWISGQVKGQCGKPRGRLWACYKVDQFAHPTLGRRRPWENDMRNISHQVNTSSNTREDVLDQ